ncbi:MAG: MoaD/ThiS family protein [Oscillospiraceae bacterium]|nr:MoaD/ThiS family protein [Oscillospiraceae bacterium]
MTVNFYGNIKKHTNGEGTYVPVNKTHSTLRDVLDELNVHFGDSFASFISDNEACLFLVNGKGIKHTGGLDTPVCNGDIINILPFVEAG